ncbi:MAG: hypothetical protein P8N49_02955 [Opitutales bacterium]|nr:hypothetical protein [Opitutales bacterium]
MVRFDDLALWWPLDGTLSDASGNNRHGSNTGGSMWQQGNFGQALTFSGDHYIFAENYKGVTGTDARTFSLWLNTLSSTTQTLAYWGNPFNGQAFWVRLHQNAFSVEFDGPGMQSTSTSFNEGIWHHLAISMPAGGDNRANAKLYINGKESSSHTLLGSNTQVTTTPNEDFRVGNSWEDAEYFAGKIDDIRLYDVQLRNFDVKQIYQEGTGGPEDMGEESLTISLWAKPSSLVPAMEYDIATAWYEGNGGEYMEARVGQGRVNESDYNDLDTISPKSKKQKENFPEGITLRVFDGWFNDSHLSDIDGLGIYPGEIKTKSQGLPENSNLTLWLDAADETTITTGSGNEVATWENKIDPSVKMHSSSYRPSTGAVINGLNAIGFDKRNSGQMEYMEAKNNASTNWTPATMDGTISGKVQDLTLFLVARIDTLRRTRMPFGFGWGDHLPWNNGSIFWWHESGRLSFSLGGSGQTFLLTMIHSKSTGRQQAYVNGNKMFEGPRTNDNHVGDLGVFKWPDSTSSGNLAHNGWGVDWTTGEILVANRTHTNSLRYDIEGYLASKWGLIDKLPSEHAYSGYGRLNVKEDAVFLVKTVLPSVTPADDFVLWEMGNNITGAYLGFKSGALRLRAGSNETLEVGQVPSQSDLAIIDVPHGEIAARGFADDKVHELRWEIQIGENVGSSGKVKLWVDDVLMGESSAGTILGDGQWAEITADNGGFTRTAGEICGFESNSTWPYTILPPLHYMVGNGFRIKNDFVFEESAETFSSPVQVVYGNLLDTLTGGLTGTDTMGAIWFGKMVIGNDGFLPSGEITFGTESDDGSAFWVDLDRDGDFSRGGKKGDELIVSNLGGHGNRKRVGTAIMGYKSPLIMRAGDAVKPGVFIGTDGLSTALHSTEEGEHLIVGSTQLMEEEWNHLVMVVDRQKGEVLHYMNGKLVGESSFSEEALGYNYRNNWFIGGFAELDYFEGWVDDLRLYSTALSDTAISSIYNWGSGDMGISGKIEAHSVTDANPISVTLKYYQFENLVNVSGLTFEEVNSSITGGQVDPASFTPSGLAASTFSFLVIPDDQATEITIGIPEGAATYLGESTLPVNYLIKIIPDIREKDNLLHWWWFDEAVATSTIDGMGNAMGTLLGNTSWSADALSQTSLHFESSGDLADLGFVDGDLKGGEFGLSFWFRRTEESFSWSPNLVSNVMISLGDENGSVLEIGSKGNAIDLFMATEIKTQQVAIGGEVKDDHWHFLSIAYDENASDQRELQVFLDGTLLGSTSEFGGSLKVKNHHQWLLGSSTMKDPSLGRFIGKIDDFRVYDIQGDLALHNASYNSGSSDLSLTIEADYNATTYQNPISVNVTFKKYGQDCPVDFNGSYIESENTGNIAVSGVGAHWNLEFNSTVNPGRIRINFLESAGVESTGIKSKPYSLQIGFGRPIVALDRLSAWWTFDEDNGSQVFDYLGKFQGTFEGIDDAVVAFDSTHSMFGSSLYFPHNAWVNTDAYALDLGIDSDNERAISFWMYTEDQELEGGDIYQPGVYGIGRRYSFGGSEHGIWAIRGFWDQSKYRRFFSSHYDHDPQVYIAEGVKNKWVHVVHQYQGKTILVFVNGTLRLSNVREGIETQNYFPLQIGRWTEEGSVLNGNGVHKKTYKGWIDDFRVYDAALSEAEIQQIYGEGDGDFNILSVLEVASIVDGDPTQGRIRFTRNQETISDLDFNLSNDLLMTGGFIDPDSLAWDASDGSYTFDYTVDPAQADPNIIQYLSPKLFPGLTLWLDANDSSAFQLNGVSTWGDKSGNDRHATISLGSPLYIAAGPNEMPVVQIRRDYGNDAFDIGGSAFFAKEHYYVFRSSEPEEFDYYGGILGHSSSRKSNYLFENAKTSFHQNMYPFAVSQNGTELSSPFALSTISDFMVLRIEVNDDAVGPYSNYRIGTTNEGSAWCTSTDIGEVLAFENTLSAENRAKVEGYLAHKWGLAGSLPNDHSFSVSAPLSWSPGDVSPALWLDATDSATISTGGPHWLDKSNAKRLATANGSPTLVEGAYNGKPVMRYSGTEGQFHKFGDITNIRTIFWVWKDGGGGYFMLGDNNRYHFHKGSFLFNSSHTSTFVSNGLLRLNGIEVETRQTNLPSEMCILSLRTTGNVEASNFSSDRSIPSRYANGDLAELLIYNVALNDAQISNIEYYLNQKWGLGHSIESAPMIILGANQVQDVFGQGNDLTYAETRKMHRAVTRGNDLLAWWPLDEDSIGSNIITGKSLNERTADLYDAGVTAYGKFGRGLLFDIEQTDARVRINDNGVDIGTAWTLSVWVKNILPPASSGFSTLFRGEDRQADADFDRYLVIKGSNGILHSYDGADDTAESRFRSAEYVVDPVALSGWHLFTVVGVDSKTLFYVDGNLVGDSDRKEQSDVFYIGNSSNNEIFAQFMDDIRIYGAALNSVEISQLYGGGFGDQFPSILLDENSTREANPRVFKISTGKDNTLIDLTGFDSNDWSLSSGSIIEMNATGLTGQTLLSVDFNGTESVSLTAPFDSGRDSNGKPMEEFRAILFAHDLVYEEDSLLSRWSFEETNGSIVRDLGVAQNNGFLKGDAQLTIGKFGRGLLLDGDGDYLSIPHFRGFRDEGNFTLSAWVKPTLIGVDNNIDDAGIFCTDTVSGKTVQLWYNVNGSGTGNRTFSLLAGQANINANTLDGPDALAIQDRWQHLVVVIEGQERTLYHNSKLVAHSIGSDSMISLEGSGVRLGASSHSSDFDFEGSLDDIRLYSRPFTEIDVSVLYGNGNGDLGVSPVLTVNAKNSSPSFLAKIDFFRFGEKVNVSDFNSSDITLVGGSVSDFASDGVSFTFSITPFTNPSRMSLSLSKGAAKVGLLGSSAITEKIVHHQAIVAEDYLALWFSFEENNGSSVIDLSQNYADGQLYGGQDFSYLPGKFGQSLELLENDSVQVNSEVLGLHQSLTVSLWVKVLDDSSGVLVSNGQFALQYNEDLSLRAMVSTSEGWSMSKANLLSGEWIHCSMTYDGEYLRLFLNGFLANESSHSGYLTWGDGDDHILYLNRASTAGNQGKAIYDELRIYKRALSSSEISTLWSSGTGDLGLSPLISGPSPFYQVPTRHSVTFIDSNQAQSVTGLSASDLNVSSNATVQAFDLTTFAYDLDVSTVDDRVRVSVAGAAVEHDGNLSMPGSFEFYRRKITAVENDLLAWYRFDEVNKTTAFDSSGRLRHAHAISPDATLPNGGNLAFSPNFLSPFDASNAFDNVDDDASGRWLPKQTDLDSDDKVFVRYDFEDNKTIAAYKIVAQHWMELERSPKVWKLQGSHDDSTWITVDTESNQTGWQQWEARTFIVDNPSAYRYYRLRIFEAGGSETYLGIAEIEFYPEVKTEIGLFGNAIDLNDQYVELPFKIDHEFDSTGFSFASWIYPRQILGGITDEKIIFSSKDSGWGWSGSIRNGLLTVWSGSQPTSSSLKLYANQWAHTVFTFDPTAEKTTVYLNSIPTTFNSLDFGNNSSFLKIGKDLQSRSFNGLIDDTRVWGRPLVKDEVLKLWGNGLGDLGPKARIQLQSPVWSPEVNGTLIFNQQVTDFTASEDLNLTGFSISSIEENPESNQTIYNFTLQPESFTQGTYSIKLKANAVTDFQGLENSEVYAPVEFRPHRVKESALSLWWALDNNLSDSSSGSNDGSGSPAFSSDGIFGSAIGFDGETIDKHVSSNGILSGSPNLSLSLWLYLESSDFYPFSIDGPVSPSAISIHNQRPLFTFRGLNQQTLPGTDINELWAHDYILKEEWSHLVLTYDLKNKLARLFINGTLDTECSFAGTLPFPSLLINLFG